MTPLRDSDKVCLKTYFGTIVLSSFDLIFKKSWILKTKYIKNYMFKKVKKMLTYLFKDWVKNK